jgi:hypothetical protein
MDTINTDDIENRYKKIANTINRLCWTLMEADYNAYVKLVLEIFPDKNAIHEEPQNIFLNRVYNLVLEKLKLIEF